MVMAVVESFRLKLSDAFEISHTVTERVFYCITLAAAWNGEAWKIRKADAKQLLSLPGTPYIQGIRYDKITKGLVDWELHNTPSGGLYVSDSYAIENIINAWVYAVRRGEIGKFAIK